MIGSPLFYDFILTILFLYTYLLFPYGVRNTLSLSLKICFCVCVLYSAAGGEARSADQAAWEARPCWHQPGPAGGQRLGQISPYERHHCESKERKTYFISII